MKRLREDGLAPRLSRGLFCAVVTHPFQNMKKSFHVFLSHDPLGMVKLHNQRRSRLRITRPVAPFCQPIRITGPFYYEPTAIRFADDLVHGTRGLASLLKHLEDLAREYNVTVYSAEEALRDPTGKRVELAEALSVANAPPSYIAAAQQLDNAFEILCTKGKHEID